MTTVPAIQSAVMKAIFDASLTDIDGMKVCHLDAGAILGALGLISAAMIATSPEAQTAEGLKRVLRRQARRLERQVAEFRRHTEQHGSPFVVQS